MPCCCEIKALGQPAAYPGGSGGCPSILAAPQSWARAVPSVVVDLWAFTVYGRLQLGPATVIALMTPIVGAAFAAEIVGLVVVTVLRGNCSVSGIAREEARRLKQAIGLLRPLVPAQLHAPLATVERALSGDVDAASLCRAFNAAKGFSSDTASLPAIPCPASSRARTSSTRTKSTTQIKAEAKARAKAMATASARARQRLKAEKLKAARAKKNAPTAGGGLVTAGIGAALGFAMGGPVGAVAGAAAGLALGR